ncbi:hypothetical protein ACIP98_36875 [Streptomyces sp. NPDC088354]|nr:hypothetical protein [Streptomyces sp. MI02-7b]MDX3077798.1 hypothetical protein [Streptomyces sp. MI02-7b]
MAPPIWDWTSWTWMGWASSVKSWISETSVPAGAGLSVVGSFCRSGTG